MRPVMRSYFVVITKLHLFSASYEIKINDMLVFSKLETGRFPDEAEVSHTLGIRAAMKR